MTHPHAGQIVDGSFALHGFSVPFRFPVVFGEDIWSPTRPLFADIVRRLEPERRHRVMVVVDEFVAREQPWLQGHIEAYFAAHQDSLELAGPVVLVPGGEAVKNDVTHTFALLQRVNDLGIDRHAFITVIGGGAVLDMVSFAAAIAHRGIRIIRMPTTVLAQGDSGIAVKNGINLFGKKNFIGTFVPPFAVINDIQMLRSLERRDVIAGVSEAIKVSLLRDPDFFGYLEQHASRIAAGDDEPLGPVVRRSAELHLAHICGNGDPFELGSARPLDFGHWAAHKLESITANRLRHGEAVAIGMALDLTYSVRKGFLARETCERILAVLEATGLRLWDEALLDRQPDGRLTLLKGLDEFREHLGGDLHVTMLRDIGRSFEVTEMDDAVVADSLVELSNRASAAARPAGASAVMAARTTRPA